MNNIHLEKVVSIGSALASSALALSDLALSDLASSALALSDLALSDLALSALEGIVAALLVLCAFFSPLLAAA
jgi:hypothetical protein